MYESSLCIILPVSFITLCNSAGITPITNGKYQTLSKRDSCLDLIAKNNFRPYSSLAIFTSDNYQENLSQMLQTKEDQTGVSKLVHFYHTASFLVTTFTINGSCSLSKSVRGLSDYSMVDYFIMIGYINEIEQSLKTFCFECLVSERSSFTIFLEAQAVGTKTANDVENLLNILWKHEQQNVVVLIENQEKDIVEIYSWFPLHKTSRAKVVDECTGQTFRRNAVLFPNKIPNNLEGMTLRTALIVSPPYVCQHEGGFTGFDIELITALASALNFNPEYITNATKESKTSNNSAQSPWDRVLCATASGDVDIAVGALIATSERQMGLSLDISHIYARDSVEFFVTRELLSADFEKLWMISLVLQILGVHLCISVTMHIFSWHKKGKHFSRAAVEVWGILTEVATTRSPMSTKQSFLWVVCAIFALHFNAAVRSDITSMLTRPLYVERIESLQDLVESDLPITVALPFVPLEEIFTEGELWQLHNRINSCYEQIEHCLVGAMSSRYHAYVYLERIMRFLNYAMWHGHNYRALDRRVAVHNIAIFIRRNHFLGDKITKLVIRSAQAGLFDYWYRKTLRNHKSCDLRGPHWDTLLANKKEHSEDDPRRIAKPLNMQHFKLSFSILLVGLIFSKIMFIFEVFSICKTPFLTLFYNLSHLASIVLRFIRIPV